MSKSVASAEPDTRNRASNQIRLVSAKDFTNFIFLPVVFRNYPTSNQFGVQMSPISVSGGLNKIVEARSYWVGGAVAKWSDIEPNPGDRNWSALNSTAQQWLNATQNGLQPIANIRSTPGWAQLYDGYSCGPMESQYFDEFASFMRDLVSRYSKAPYNVKYWEIWNEEDIDPALVPSPDNDWGCWGDDSDQYYGGIYYGDMLKYVYPAIKQADPNAQVLVGGLLLDCDPQNPPLGKDCLSSKYFEGILVNGGGPYFDGISYHAYDYRGLGGGVGTYSNSNWASAWNTTGPVLIAKLNYLQNLLNSFNITGKYLINTESAVVCDACTNDVTHETTKAYYIAQAYASAIRYGLKGNMWYSLLGWRNSGLLTASFDELPGFQAFKFGRQILAPSSSLGDIGALDISSMTGVKGYKFRKDDRDVWIVWSLDGSSHTVNLIPGIPDAVYDSLGTSLTPSASLQVTLNPTYIEWIP